MALSPAAWYRPGVGVTGSLTASNWADQSGNGRDLAQGTAGNQPIYLPFAGTAYAYLPGVSGNYFATPDSAASSITGDIDIRARVAMNDWTPGAEQTFVAKYVPGGAAYRFGTSVANRLQLTTSADGSSTTTEVSTAAPSVSDAAQLWVRVTLDVDNGATGHTTRFYTSTDDTNDPGDVTWTQLGSDVVTAGVISIVNSANAVEIGAIFTGTLQLLPGKVYRAAIYNGINGTLAVDFNPSTFAETSTNGATAVASTGETWTLNSTGAKPAQIVKSASLLFDGAAHYLQTSAFGAIAQPLTAYLVCKQVSWTFQDTLFDLLNAGFTTLSQQATTPRLSLAAGVGITNENANLAVGAKGIVSCVFDGANSLLQINSGSATTGNPGTGGAAQITLGAAHSAAFFGNIQAWELIAFSAAHTAAQRASVQQWLSIRHSISL